MAIDFPASPSVNDIHTSGGKRWTWNGTSWERSGTPGPGDTISATNDNTTSTLYPVLVTGTGSNTAKIATTSSKSVSFNASNGNLTATTFTGTLNTAAQTNITSVGTLGSLNVTGNATIGGVLTYEDVKNVDSVGIITARTGIRVTGGNVGIGTDSPSELLEIASGTACGIAIKDDNNGFAASKIKVENGGRDLAIGAPQDIFFKDIDTGTKHLYIESTGHIGIGTDNPDELLELGGTNPVLKLHDVAGGSTHGLKVNHDGVNATIDLQSAGLLTIKQANGSTNSQGIVFNTGNSDTERLRITSDGKIGIGTDNPESMLHIHSGTPRITMSDSGTNAHHRINTDSSVGNFAFDVDYNSATSTPSFIVNIKGTEKLRIKSDGKVGIGTNNALSRLHVADTNTTVWPFTSVVADTYAYTPYPHELIIDNDVRGTEGSFAGIYFNAGADTDGSKVSTARIAAIDTGSYKADLVFSNRGAGGSSHKENLRITSDGNVGIGTNNPTEKLEVLGNLVVAKTLAVNRPRIVLSAPNDGSTYRHLFGANLQVNNSGTYTTPTANISGGGWEYFPANSLNTHGNLVYQSAPDTNATTSTPVERFRIDNDGNVGIGTDNPAHLLHLEGSSPVIQFEDSDNAANIYSLINAAGSAGRLLFQVDPANAGTDSYVAFDIDGGERLRITSTGRVNIGQASDVDHTLCVAGTDGTTSLTGGHNQGIQLQNKSTTDGTYSQIEWRTSSGGRYARIAGIQDDANGNGGQLVFLTETSGGTTTERLRLTSGGHIVTQGLSSYSFQNDSANAKIFEVSGDGTVGEYGVINISGNQNANNSNIGNLRFINRENSNSSSGNNAGSKQVAAIQAYIKTSDTNAGDDSGGILSFHTKGENAVNGERVRIDEAGRLLVGNFTDDIGDGTLQVYTADRKHPAIRTNSPNANGYTMFGDAYQSDESQVNIGVSYSSSSLVLSRSCKVSDTADNTYLSSQDTYNARPTALVLDNDGALRFHTTETNATTTTDSAVSLTEVFKIDKVGNIYQRITGRFLYMGASNQLQMGVASSGDGYLNSVSGDLKIADAGNPITIVRSDGFQMYQDIYFAAAGKGICLGTTSNTDSNTLDDYEEGDLTWYLRKHNSTSTGNDNGSVVKYTKVGRMVHISGRIRTDSTGSASNDYFYLSGTLPFTPSTPGTAVVGHWRSQDQLDNSLTASIAWGESNTTIYLYTIDSKADYSPSSNNVPASHQTNLVMTFSFTYQAS